MDAITMPLISSLLPKLEKDFPHLSFTAGERFAWSPSRQVVSYDPDDPTNVALLLHELSHGLLEHRNYQKDVELLAMEAAAWERAYALADQYHVSINKHKAEEHLDTYREWLHARSTCPACEATGVQTQKRQYRCVACSHEWRVNEARLCALRRYRLAIK
jgi:hypothetical protein